MGCSLAYPLRLAALLMLLLSAGCASQSAGPGEGLSPPRHGIDDVPAGTRDLFAVADPLEPWNRWVYRFNAEFDEAIFLPAVGLYETVAPEPVRDSVANFFANLGNLTTFGNQILQGKPMAAGQSAFRFALNSTLGLFGLFDPASAIGVPRHEEDFGQTLGTWGLGEGAYLVLPLLGPSNLRDTTGLVVDKAAYALIDPFHTSSLFNEYPPLLALQILDLRYGQSFRYFETGSPFEYDLVRFLYTEKRKLDIAR